MRRELASCLIALTFVTGCQGGAGAPAKSVPEPPPLAPAAPAARPAPYEQAQAELKAGNFEGAAALLKEAVAADPKDAKAYNDLAFAYIRLQQWPQAIQAGETARGLDPQNPAVLFNLGRAYLGAGQFGQAVSALQQANWKNPKNADIAWYLGLAYEGDGQLLSARRVFAEALAVTPDDTELEAAVKRVQTALGAQKKVILQADLTGDGRISQVWAQPGALRVVDPGGKELLTLDSEYHSDFQAEAVDLGVSLPVLWVSAGPGCPSGYEHALYAYDQATGRMKELVWHGCATVVSFDKEQHSATFDTRAIPAYVSTSYVFDGKTLVKTGSADSLVLQFIWPANVGLALTHILQRGTDEVGLFTDKAMAEQFIKAWSGRDTQVTVPGPDHVGKEFTGEITVKRGDAKANGVIHMVEVGDVWHIDRLEWK